MQFFNAEIESILTQLKIPFAYLYYNGHAETYITYMQYDKDSTLAGDDTVIGCVQYYDIDIYSKSNYLNIIRSLIPLMQANGWTYQPSRDSADLYEQDTGYFHKTLSFAKESEV